MTRVMHKRTVERRMIGPSKRADIDATQARCALPPFPDGWWVVALSGELRPERILERRWMGRLIVAWRDQAGIVCVADAYCPHMGARLSPSAGGRLSGGRLKCPFHGFEYDASGACVAAPNSPPPSRCRLATYETRETAGFVFAYFGNRGRKPDWMPPALDDDGWSTSKVRRFHVRTHPQDIAENSVDMNHLLHVHGWQAGCQSAAARADGRYYTAAFAYRGRSNLPGTERFRYETEATVHVWGLGFVYTESDATAFGMRVRNWFLASPVDGEYFDAFLGVQTKRLGASGRGSGKLRGFFDRLVLRSVRSLVMYEAGREFGKDVAIWNHRRYEEFPRLCASDGELHRFRRYCRQFYPTSAGAVCDALDDKEAAASSRT